MFCVLCLLFVFAKSLARIYNLIDGAVLGSCALFAVLHFKSIKYTFGFDDVPFTGHNKFYVPINALIYTRMCAYMHGQACAV